MSTTGSTSLTTGGGQAVVPGSYGLEAELARRGVSTNPPTPLAPSPVVSPRAAPAPVTPEQGAITTGGGLPVVPRKYGLEVELARRGVSTTYPVPTPAPAAIADIGSRQLVLNARTGHIQAVTVEQYNDLPNEWRQVAPTIEQVQEAYNGNPEEGISPGVVLDIAVENIPVTTDGKIDVDKAVDIWGSNAVKVLQRVIPEDSESVINAVNSVRSREGVEQLVLMAIGATSGKDGGYEYSYEGVYDAIESGRLSRDKAESVLGGKVVDAAYLWHTTELGKRQTEGAEQLVLAAIGATSAEDGGYKYSYEQAYDAIQSGRIGKTAVERVLGRSTVDDIYGRIIVDSLVQKGKMPDGITQLSIDESTGVLSYVTEPLPAVSASTRSKQVIDYISNYPVNRHLRAVQVNAQSGKVLVRDDITGDESWQKPTPYLFRLMVQDAQEGRKSNRSFALYKESPSEFIPPSTEDVKKIYAGVIDTAIKYGLMGKDELIPELKIESKGPNLRQVLIRHDNDFGSSASASGEYRYADKSITVRYFSDWSTIGEEEVKEILAHELSHHLINEHVLLSGENLRSEWGGPASNLGWMANEFSASLIAGKLLGNDFSTIETINDYGIVTNSPFYLNPYMVLPLETVQQGLDVAQSSLIKAGILDNKELQFAVYREKPDWPPVVKLAKQGETKLNPQQLAEVEKTGINSLSLNAQKEVPTSEFANIMVPVEPLLVEPFVGVSAEIGDTAPKLTTEGSGETELHVSEEQEPLLPELKQSKKSVSSPIKLLKHQNNKGSKLSRYDYMTTLKGFDARSGKSKV